MEVKGPSACQMSAAGLCWEWFTTSSLLWLLEYRKPNRLSVMVITVAGDYSLTILRRKERPSRNRWPVTFHELQVEDYSSCIVSSSATLTPFSTVTTR
jgi:hypothetical protein